MTEIELLDRIKNDPSAFSELFKLYYKSIFGYILRRTGNFDDTADIAADTFLKAFKNISGFSYKGISVKVWLYRIATNEVNQYYRNRQKHNSLFERIDFENKGNFKNLLSEDRKELELELHKHEQFLAVLKELKTLPIKYQEVISLRYFEGKNNKEIVDILDINEGTLKSLLSRGLEKLREKCNQI
ncbi:MAG TPA: RNA polymerase sigma factor [Bacteroidia bacterium]|nr:RNA polymerase sigma factor [Bacteroidia bacterium]